MGVSALKARVFFAELTGQRLQMFFDQEGIEQRLDHLLIFLGQLLDLLKLPQQLPILELGLGRVITCAFQQVIAADQVIGPQGDPGSLFFQMKAFLQHQRERGYSERTVGNREDLLIAFIRWCDERGLTRPQEITRPILERYQRHLFLYRKADGEPLSARSQTVRITPIRVWFKWLTKSNRLLYNPAADLNLPRMEQRLPKHILSSDEAEKILNVPDVATFTGVRDRAMLETLYSTGMRRMELINLNWSSIDYERGTVMIRQGKGKKDRMIPIGERALTLIKKYRDEVRPQFVLGDDDGTLFLTQQGESFSPNRLTQLVR